MSSELREVIARAIEAEAERLAAKTVSERDRSIYLRGQGDARKADLAMSHAHGLRHQRNAMWDAARIARQAVA